jgi:hypothetical protein
MKDEKAIKKAQSLIRKGYSEKKIIRKLKGSLLSPSEIFEVAKLRIKAKKKFGNFAKKLYLDEFGLRYSTPEQVAKYRAERLRCGVLADVSCGVGIQLLFFARVCDKIYGVEINRKRAFYARLNAEAFGLNNIEIIEGNALSDEVIRQVGDAEIIFSDPSRPPGEKFRTIENLEPNPLKIIEKYGGKDIAFELPPQIPPSRIKIAGEKEYTSLDFRLNRLALYTGALGEYERSAISIPSLERITDEDEPRELEFSDKIESFIFEVDNTVAKAELLPNLLGKLNFDAKIIKKENRRTLLTSDDEVTSSFLKRYRVLDIVKFEISLIELALKKLDAGKVTLRFTIPPERYWDFRNGLERNLTGDNWLYLFKAGERAIITSTPS